VANLKVEELDRIATLQETWILAATVYDSRR